MKQEKSNRSTKRSTRENDMTKESSKTKTGTNEEAVAPEVQGTRSPLALVDPSMPAPGAGYIAFQMAKFDQEKKALLKKTYSPLGCTDLEFEFFIAFCERTGLDPMLKQAYLVKRGGYQKDASGRDVWVDKMEPMASEAGMAAKADGLPDFRGILDGCVYKGDVFEIDNVAQTVVHKTNPVTRGPLIGAWAHVQREGRKVPITYFTFAEKAGYTKEGKLTKFWQAGGPSQLLKCCRAEQWRQGWPNIFGGQFVPEEMREEHEVNPSPADTSDRDTTDKLMDRAKAERAKAEKPEEAEIVEEKKPQPTVEVVAEKPAAQKEPEGAKPIPIGTAIKAEVINALTAELEKAGIEYQGDRLRVDLGYYEGKVKELSKWKAANPSTAKPPAEPEKRDHATTEKLPHQQADAKKAEVAAQGPLMVFGKFKSQQIKSLSGPDLLEQIAYGEANVGSLSEDKAKRVRVCIDACKAEQREREAALLGDEREPGSDG